MKKRPALTGLSWGGEDDHLPFGPAHSQPLLLHDIARSIRASGAEIWLIAKQPDESGMLFRANIGQRQFRVFVPIPGRHLTTPPTEKGTSCHVVTTLPELKSWLEAMVSANRF